VEEAKTEEQLAELLGLCSAIEEFGVRDRINEEGVLQVGLETLGCFVGHLDTILEHGDWEVVRGVGSQPETEISVADLRVG